MPANENLPPTLFWLSFADGALPEGSQFLGACIVQATHFIEAVQVAHALGINPGGECVGHGPWTPDPSALAIINDGHFETLMDRAKCEAFDDRMEARNG